MVMTELNQGDIIRLENPKINAVVLSRRFFNRSGMVVLCPAADTASEDALHIPVKTKEYAGIALLEHLKSMDLRARHFKKIGEISIEQIQDISDAVQDIFNYYPLSGL